MAGLIPDFIYNTIISCKLKENRHEGRMTKLVGFSFQLRDNVIIK